MCTGNSRRLCCDVHCSPCHEKSFASHQKSKYLVDVEPRSVFRRCKKEFDFMCDCGHAFTSSLDNVSGNGSWCPYCGKKELCEYSDCEQCFENSFASHPKSKYLVDVEPRSVFKSTPDKHDFMCDCGHAFTASLSNVSTCKWCPYCAHQKLCEYSDCEECFKNSFASHPKSEYIFGVEPRTVFKSSNESFNFKCTCGHVFPSTLNHVSNGTWCPYCSNPPKKLCDDLNCEQCFKNSFASHPKSKYLVSLDPRTVFKSGYIKPEFICERGHKFSMLLGNVTCCEKWCPHCKHKTEDILCTFIETHYSSVQRQFSADWCKNKRFDVAVHELCVIIELDGPQHIDKQIKNWGTPDENRAKDIYKMKCANDNGYSVVRILQEDVLCDTYDWKTELMNVLHEYPFITNVYLCKNNEYSGHEELYKQETLILTKQEDES